MKKMLVATLVVAGVTLASPSQAFGMSVALKAEFRAGPDSTHVSDAHKATVVKAAYPWPQWTPVADHSNQDYSGRNLQGSKWSEVDLRNCNFSGATLTGADFSGADLTGANFSGADLTGATLSGAIVSSGNFGGANLTNATLFGLNSSNVIADLQTVLPSKYKVVNGYILGEAVVLPAGADLRNQDLSGMDLRNVYMFKADLSGANLTNADLGNQVFNYDPRYLSIHYPDVETFGNLYSYANNSTVLEGSNLAGANLTGANLHNVQFLNLRSGSITISQETTLPLGLDFFHGYLVGNGVDLHGVNFSDLDLRNLHLNGVNLRGANLENANLARTLIYGPDLTAANLRGANLVDAVISNAYSSFNSADFTNAHALNSSLQGDFRNANISGTDFTGGNLSASQNGGLISNQATAMPAGEKLIAGYILGPACNLENTVFRNADLRGISLAGADLAGADFEFSDFTSGDLELANLTGADLSNAVVPNVSFIGVKATGAKLVNLDLSNRNLTSVWLDGATLAGSNLSNSKLSPLAQDDKGVYTGLQNVDFSGANMVGIAIDGARFKNVALSNVDLTSARISNSTFSDVDLHGANLSRTVFTDSTISGANFQAASAGQSVWVCVNLSNSDFTGAAVPLSFGQIGCVTDKFSGLVLSNTSLTGTVSISGSRYPGGTLTSSLKNWDGQTNVNYQWLLDGNPIAGQNQPQITVDAAYLNHALSLRVQAVSPLLATSTSGQVAVVLGQLTNTPQPQVTGNFQVGSSLVASAGNWDSGVVIGYQWLRDGSPIQGSSSSSYQLASSDLGHKISVQVTGSMAGFASSVQLSTPQTVGPGAITSGIVKASGTAKVGKSLTAKVTPWVAGAQITYQWLLDGKNIKGATKATLKLATSYKKHKVSVLVTQSAVGYNTVSVTSGAVKVG